MLLCVLAAATSSADGLADCARIAQRDARLDCYDALSHRPPDPTPRVPATAPPAPAPTAVAPPVNMDDPNAFGLTAAQQGIVPAGPARISARIADVGATQVVLDNGQVWSVLDPDGGLSKGDAVTIKKAALGSFLMIAPSRHNYRVRRIR